MIRNLKQVAAGLGLALATGAALAHGGHGEHGVMQQLALDLGFEHSLPVLGALYLAGFIGALGAVNLAGQALGARLAGRSALAWRVAAGLAGGLGTVLLARG
jgi:hypothetical protein